MAADPKPCPWCGRQPKIEPWHGGGPDKHAVHCMMDDGCFVSPMVVGETLDEAISRWNDRHVDR